MDEELKFPAGKLIQFTTGSYENHVTTMHGITLVDCDLGELGGKYWSENKDVNHNDRKCFSTWLVTNNIISPAEVTEVHFDEADDDFKIFKEA